MHAETKGVKDRSFERKRLPKQPVCSKLLKSAVIAIRGSPPQMAHQMSAAERFIARFCAPRNQLMRWHQGSGSMQHTLHAVKQTTGKGLRAELFLKPRSSLNLGALVHVLKRSVK